MSAQPKTYLAPAEYLAFERASPCKDVYDKVEIVSSGDESGEPPIGS